MLRGKCCFVPLANAHASPVRLGLVLGEHTPLHLLPALVVQHAQSKKYLVPSITRKKSGDKRSFIWLNESPQHASVIIIGEIDIMEMHQHTLRYDWKYFKDINLVDVNYRPFNAANWPLTDCGLLGPVTLTPVTTE